LPWAVFGIKAFDHAQGVEQIYVIGNGYGSENIVCKIGPLKERADFTEVLKK
jgi:hypothetical protein